MSPVRLRIRGDRAVRPAVARTLWRLPRRVRAERQAMPRLSAVDLAMFVLETDERPFNVGPLVVLKPPAGFRGNFADKLFERMLKRPLGAPFHYRLNAPPIGIPALEVDPNADLNQPRPSDDLERVGLKEGGFDGAPVRDSVQAARNETRSFAHAVGVLHHRWPRGWPGCALRQGPPRHHRRPHLCESDVQLAVGVADRSHRARDVGRSSENTERGPRPRGVHRADRSGAEGCCWNGRIDARSGPHAR